MSDLAAHIHITVGIASVECGGTEHFVTTMYPLLRELVTEYATVPVSVTTTGTDADGQDSEPPGRPRNGRAPAAGRSRTRPTSSRRPSRRAESAPGHFELDDEAASALSGFLNSKLPDQSDYQEVFTVVAYFLIKNMKLSTVDHDHASVVFERLGLRKPSDMPVIFRNIASRKQWLRRSESGGYILTNKGENFVRHDLPRATTKQNGG
jgi:hypothetical protein